MLFSVRTAKIGTCTWNYCYVYPEFFLRVSANNSTQKNFAPQELRVNSKNKLS